MAEPKPHDTTSAVAIAGLQATIIALQQRLDRAEGAHAELREKVTEQGCQKPTSTREHVVTACAVCAVIFTIVGAVGGIVHEGVIERIASESRFSASDRQRIEQAAASSSEVAKLNERVGQKFTEVETQIDAIEQMRNSQMEGIWRALNEERRDSMHEPFEMPNYFSSIARRGSPQVNGNGN